jgi:glycosyltransferase involved in cell wall biosynthesis
MEERKISVVIPARNEENEIGRAIDSVFDTGYGNFEIVVVNDGSTDKTGGIVRSYMKKHSNVTLINFDEGHSAAFARNRGAEKADGEILVFLDADTPFSKNFLFEVNKDFENKNIDAIGNDKKNTYTNLLSHLLSLLAYRSPVLAEMKKGTMVEENVSFNVFVIRKGVFLELGKFNENIFYYEDTELTERFFEKGYKAIWNPDIVFYSAQPDTLKDFYRQYQWSGKGISTIENKKDRLKKAAYNFLKVGFILIPFIILFFYFKVGVISVIAAYFLTYFYSYRASKSLFYSVLIVPIMYIKNLFEFYNLVKFTLFGNRRI